MLSETKFASGGKKYLILFIVIAGTNLFAGAPDTLWTRTFGGTNYDDSWSVQQTKDNGFIISGITYSFGVNTPTYPNAYLIRLSKEAAGVEEQAKDTMQKATSPSTTLRASQNPFIKSTSICYSVPEYGTSRLGGGTNIRFTISQEEQ